MSAELDSRMPTDRHLALADEVERLRRERDEQRALAERSIKRLVEATEPGSIGAFARRDIEIERNLKLSAENDTLRTQLAEAAEREKRLRELLSVVVTETRTLVHELSTVEEIGIRVNGVQCTRFHGVAEAKAINDWRLRRDAALAALSPNGKGE